jgi:hypothetical protein
MLQWLSFKGTTHDAAMAELQRNDAAKCQTVKIPFFVWYVASENEIMTPLIMQNSSH